ncbi:putative 2-hydroxymuconate-6-semialdehyde hydrolase [Rosa chinensis]|uniref:Putative 2-hydroxymuconate-6-semialdehyde hydrolase n=1 Tax=Rosa chinensis TaxID=74649 RepID=A0A2P6P468_ROSCH|nr:probable lysophospholipase BODYGUARD 3 [Rosa chinensis]PRQ16719.1 putative 2-hydroxymuconate-6-semialdehyde hydrolase [Rosa chinensis]
MDAMGKTRSVLTLTGRFINEAVSFFVFSILDLVDFFLCFLYKVADLFFEAEWKPCYCSSSKEAITNSGKILLSEQGESKIVCLSSTKLQLEEISDTLYTRPSLLSEVSKMTTRENKRGSAVRSKFTVNSTIVEMLQGKIGGQICHPIPRWSDCDCKFCTSWTSSCKESLYVKAEGPKDHDAREDVLFIHGFISSSAFWTETVFPNLSSAAKSNFRLFAIDLLGFGRSPKPADSMYTLREHLEMIEQSVLEPHKVKSFHIVAHSLGCILALALAVKHPNSIKSLTLLAPPYFPIPKGAQATQHMMRMVAPRRVWPVIAFGASIACWYEHISRTVCLLICKNHRFVEFVAKLVTRNRMRTFLLEGFFCHTHNAAWHTLHNVICGTAGKMDAYLDTVRDNLKCNVNVFHGRDDELIPVECSYNVQSRVPRARVKVIEKKDHITIVVGRQKAFARELEAIWNNSSPSG